MIYSSRPTSNDLARIGSRVFRNILLFRMASAAPITKEFLENILKKQVIDFKVSPGSKPGDNYTSILISLEIQVVDEKNPLHLLLKTFPHHPTRQKFLEENNTFLKEFQIYDIWVQKLIELQKNVIGNDVLLVPSFPKLVAGAAIDYTKSNVDDWKDLNPMLSNFILMVDVRKTYGYKMESKWTSLGYHHTKVVIEELAKYQALSLAYKSYHKGTKPAEKYSFTDVSFCCNPKQKSSMVAFMKGNYQLIVNTCKEFLTSRPEIASSISKFEDPELATDYLAMYMNPNGVDEEKVEGFMRIKPEKYTSAPLTEQWIASVHGDCWTNNILFKEDSNGNATSAFLVDLQMVCETCITTDIIYFLYTSTDTDFRKQYLDEMVSWYYERFLHFCNILKTPPYPGFSLDNFKRKIHRSKIFGFLFAVVGLPSVLQSVDSTVDMDDIEVTEGSDNGEEFAAMFQKMGMDTESENILRDRFTTMLSELYEEGVL